MTKEALRIATRPPLDLPRSFITKKAAIVAKTRAGKTYTGAVIAEQMIEAGLPWYALDPTGAWWGLRSHFPVVIIGGQHADLLKGRAVLDAPKAIADAVADKPSWYVIDLSDLDDEEIMDFGAGFLKELFRLKNANRSPLHGFWDEADLFVPQTPEKNHKELRRYAEAVVRRGGIRGLGTTLITQRPALLHKNVLTQLDILIVLKITGPQDRDAVDDYVRYHGSAEQRRDLITSLAGLKPKRGDAWVYAPEEEIFRRVNIRARKSFNSSATPDEDPSVAMEPTKWTAIDREQFAEQMQAAVEKASAEDPEVLRQRITQLEQELRRQERELREQIAVGGRHANEDLVEAFQGQVRDMQAELDRRDGVIASVTQLAGAVSARAAEAVELVQRVEELSDHVRERAAGERVDASEIRDVLEQHGTDPASIDNGRFRRGRGEPSRATSPPPAPPATAPAESFDGFAPTAAQQHLLDTLASLEAIGVRAPSRAQLGLFAKVSHTSSAFERKLSAMAAAGVVAYPEPGRVALTAGGRAIAAIPDRPATVSEMHSDVRYLVGEATAPLVDVLIDAYPTSLSREELAERAGMAVTSSATERKLSKLKGLGLVRYPQPGQVAATPMLFLEEEAPDAVA